MNDVESSVVSPRPAVLGAVVSSAAYILLTLFIYNRDIIISPGAIIFMHVAFIVTSVGIAQFMMHKKTNGTANFKRLWLYGWMSVLVLALITGIFYKVFFSQSGEIAQIPNYFARMLISYNFFGLVISAIVAFFMSRI